MSRLSLVQVSRFSCVETPRLYLHPTPVLRLTISGLDMTTALVSSHPRIPAAIPPNSWELEERGSSDTSLMSTERLDLVPNFYTYSVKACLLPIRRVQHALVSLYFHHIHPMFPVVDEYRMTELHQKYRGQEELMDPSDFTVYHAIMVAGFAHLSEAQVCNTPYRSVLEGQEAQVEQLKVGFNIRKRCLKLTPLEGTILVPTNR
jgi:hypothetical protein